MTPVLPQLVLGTLMAATLAVGHRGQAYLRERPRPAVAALPAIPFLEFVALGYREAAADCAWMQAVQYYGEHRQAGNDFSEFGHFLKAVNTLDPHYEHAYVLGALVLATDVGDLQQALEVLRRGARANPHSGTCVFEMGFLSFVVGGDAAAARRYFGLAAADPKLRDRAVRFQAFLSRRLGHLETAWLLWQDLYERADSASLRIVAQENMRRLEDEMRSRNAGAAP
jgi:tetratricopeptide (TPR) repeat protein